MNTVICSITEVRKNQHVVTFLCDNCGQPASLRKSHFDRQDRHFCARDCYSVFRATKLPMSEQHAYKGIRKPGETKQVYHRNYCKSRPDNIAHLKARRYARERGATGSHTLAEWVALKERHSHKCAHCRQDRPLTKDHKIPLSEGGTDYIGNIQPLCRSCNSKKWKHIHENPELLK